MPSLEAQLFRSNITFAQNLLATATALDAQLTSVVSTDDILRAALVQGVSAFDHFVHEEVRACMLRIQAGTRRRCDGYSGFRVSMRAVADALSSNDLEWLEREIRAQHGYLSFQQPDKVADAFRLVSDVKLWPAVASQLGRSQDDVKRELKLIVQRRNRIAHEADMDPTPPRSRYPIDRGQVCDSLRFLEDVVNAITEIID